MKDRIIVILVVGFTAITAIAVQAQVEDYDKKDTPRRERTENAEPAEKFEYDSNNNGKKWDWTKARIGGNLGMAFSSGGVRIDASPSFGYKVHKMVEVGAGYKIYYYKDDEVPLVDGNGNLVGFVEYKDFIHGPITYGRFTVWNGIFIMGQWEMANKKPYYLDNPNDRINVHHLLLGGGYSSAIGSVGQVNISLLYNVLDQKESIYQFGTFGDFPLLLNISVGFGIPGGRR